MGVIEIGLATGVSPIIIQDQLPGTVHGVHSIDHDVPFALILAGPGWQLATSHECVELIIDPAGCRTVAGRGLMIQDGALQDSGGRVEYILEASDPVEDPRYAYAIDGVPVSDFYTPRYFDDAAAPGVRYSQTGALTRPLQVGENGYLSWREPDGALRQLRCFGSPVIVTLQAAPAGATEAPSLRRLIDQQTRTPRIERLHQGR